MLLTAICKLGINLIGDHVNILLLTDLCDWLQIFLRHNRTCRVAWKCKNQNLRLIRNRCKQFFRCQTELVLIFQLDCNRHSTDQLYTRYIRYIARLRDNNLIARIKHGTECHIDTLTATDGQQCFGLIIIQYVIFSLIPFTDFLTQFNQSGIRCIKCPSFFQRTDTL